MTPQYKKLPPASLAARWPSALAAAAVVFSAPYINADSSVWTQLSAGNASGIWSVSGNWSGGVIADGSGFTADFSTLNITANSTVTLDTNRTIGGLTFGDATTASHDWILSSSGGSILTLAGTTPTVTVSSRTTTLNSQLAGTDGLVKTGAGKLILNGANTYTGALTHANFSGREFGTSVTQGRLVMGNASAVGTGDVLVALGAGTAIFDLNGHSVANNIALRNDAYLENSNTTTESVVSGDIVVSGYGRIGSVFGDAQGTVRVEGDISGDNLYVNFQGGLVILNGTNTNTFIQVRGGATILGVLRAQEGVGLNSAARMEMFGGVLESNGTFTRALGTGNGQVRIGTGATEATVRAAGFSARDGELTVAIGGVETPTALTWDSGAGGSYYFSPTTLVLNAATANDKVTFVNAIDLNAANRTVAVHAATAEMSGVLSGDGGLIKIGVGKLILSGANSYTGGTTISAGTLQGNSASLTGAIENNAALVLDQATDGTLGSIISGTGTVEKTGVGILALSGANSHSGVTTVSAGTLKLDHLNALGAGGSAASRTVVANGAALDLNGKGLAGGGVAERISISGSGSGGAGALVNSSGTGASFLQLGLDTDATVGGTGRIDIWATEGTTINGGTHTLTKKGSGTLVINGGATTVGTIEVREGTLVASSTSTAFGDTNAGTEVYDGASLQLYNGSAVNAVDIAENITLANAAELAGTHNAHASANTLSGQITLTSGQATIRVASSGAGTQQLNLAGIVNGAGGFNKTGVGIVQLSAANDYTGVTTITAGTLKLASTGSIAGSSAIVNNATFDVSAVSGYSVAVSQTLKGAGTVIGDTHIAGTLAVGNSPGSMTFNDDLVLAGTTQMELAGNGGVAGTDFDFVNVLGQLTVGGALEIVSFGGYGLNQSGSYDLFDFSSVVGNFDSVSVSGTALAYADGVWTGGNGGASFSFNTSNGTLVVSAVPEPATYAVLLGVAALLVGAVRRRRQS